MASEKSHAARMESLLRASEARERETQSKLDAALDQVVVLTEALKKAAPFFDQFKIKPGIGPQTVGAEAWVVHLVLSGFALGEIQEGISLAIHRTFATAQQRVEAIRREAVECLWGRRIRPLLVAEGREGSYMFTRIENLVKEVL